MAQGHGHPLVILIFKRNPKPIVPMKCNQQFERHVLLYREPDPCAL
jgi:hypothetical protein